MASNTQDGVSFGQRSAENQEIKRRFKVEPKFGVPVPNKEDLHPELGVPESPALKPSQNKKEAGAERAGLNWLIKLQSSCYCRTRFSTSNWDIMAVWPARYRVQAQITHEQNNGGNRKAIIN